jgi:hypothetical protein|tara:strand:+ start:2643 stop:2897 length:255 start_codon:yes stop_codon:yes gene_type:complete
MLTRAKRSAQAAQSFSESNGAINHAFQGRVKMAAMTAYSKLIGSVLGGALSWAALHFGFDMSADVQTAIVSGVSALLVWAIPNT